MSLSVVLLNGSFFKFSQKWKAFLKKLAKNETKKHETANGLANCLALITRVHGQRHRGDGNVKGALLVKQRLQTLKESLGVYLVCGQALEEQGAEGRWGGAALFLTLDKLQQLPETMVPELLNLGIIGVGASRV
jgi:hypothetical protein